MRKLLNKPWFVAILAVAAIAFVWNALRDPDSSRVRRRALEPEAAASLGEGEELANETGPATLREALLSLVIPARLSDPFAPRAAAAVAEAEGPARPIDPDLMETVRLSAIWAQGSETFLLINDHICRAGDVIGRLKIESASLDGAWLSHWKGRDFVRLGGEFTLLTPAQKAAANPALALNAR